jgi:transposase
MVTPAMTFRRAARRTRERTAHIPLLSESPRRRVRADVASACFRIGKLKAYAADKLEIGRLLAAAERALADANVPELSSDTRLDVAYRAIMQAALIGMLANGYRPASSELGLAIFPELERVLDPAYASYSPSASLRKRSTISA